MPKSQPQGQEEAGSWGTGTWHGSWPSARSWEGGSWGPKMVNGEVRTGKSPQRAPGYGPKEEPGGAEGLQGSGLRAGTRPPVSPRGCRDKCFTVRLRDKPPKMSFTQPKGSGDENKAPKAAKGLWGFGTNPKDLSQTWPSGSWARCREQGEVHDTAQGLQGSGLSPRITAEGLQVSPHVAAGLQLGTGNAEARPLPKIKWDEHPSGLPVTCRVSVGTRAPSIPAPLGAAAEPPVGKSRR